MVRRYSAQETRQKLSDILGIVYYGREPVIVEKRGRPVAVVINPEEYELLLKAREERFQVLDRIWKEADGQVNPEEVERLVNEEVHALRRQWRSNERIGGKGEN